jgi:hypothetical protein
MADAYNMVIEQNLPVERVAKKFGIPITTLKDRVRGRISIDTVRSGPQTSFTQEQEAFLSQHLLTMAEMGFGYSRQETINLASDYAVHLGLREKGKPFSLTWLYSFLERWPELKVKKPRSLEIARAKSATRPTIDRYFDELNSILTKYNLKDKPGHIYNVDEKGLNLEHKPPKIIAGAHYKAQAVTAGRSKTVTVIGGGNAVGHQVPPFFIFPGIRMQPALLDGATPGASGTVSESGWSNTEIFSTYMKDHLAPLLPARDQGNYVLVMYDGHKSHVSLALIQWARENNIILFVLPPHCSHLLQPLDVTCYGPFENAWNAACHMHLRESGGNVVTRYDVCRIACRVYMATLTPSNIQSAFRRCGIHPFNPDVISNSAIAPSLAFPKPGQAQTSTVEAAESTQSARSFLEKRGSSVLQNVGTAKVRKTLSKVVGGRAVTEDVIFDKIKEHESRTTKPKSKAPITGKSQKGKTKRKTQTRPTLPSQPQPSTSGVNVTVPAVSALSDTDDTDNEHDAVCCVCGRFSPAELKYCINLTIVKWACCDRCDQWVHLRFCSPVAVLRRGDSFLCPKCTESEE